MKIGFRSDAATTSFPLIRKLHRKRKSSPQPELGNTKIAVAAAVPLLPSYNYENYIITELMHLSTAPDSKNFSELSRNLSKTVFRLQASNEVTKIVSCTNTFWLRTMMTWLRSVSRIGRSRERLGCETARQQWYHHLGFHLRSLAPCISYSAPKIHITKKAILHHSSPSVKSPETATFSPQYQTSDGHEMFNSCFLQTPLLYIFINFS